MNPQLPVPWYQRPQAWEWDLVVGGEVSSVAALAWGIVELDGTDRLVRQVVQPRPSAEASPKD